MLFLISRAISGQSKHKRVLGNTRKVNWLSSHKLHDNLSSLGDEGDVRVIPDGTRGAE